MLLMVLLCVGAAVVAPGADAGALPLGAVPEGVDGAAAKEPLGGATGEGASNEYTGNVPALYCTTMLDVGIKIFPPLYRMYPRCTSVRAPCTCE